MNEEKVRHSVELQQAICRRLAELGFGAQEQAQRVGRQLAEVAVRGKSLADDSLPLFLQIPAERADSVRQVALAIKVELEELADTLNDLRDDMADWTEFFR